jgi:hypothetical protein
MNFPPKSAIFFYCNYCDYKCIKTSDWDRHISTRKHKFRTNLNNFEQKSAKSEFMCKHCNKIYKARNSLWYHEPKCKLNKELDNNNNNNNISTELILEIIKQNSELQKHILELSKEKTMNNCLNTTHNTTNNNNNNNHFNLNVFLNETCKNAMNINEFIERIPLKLSDLEDTARLGYAEGISRIFIRGLKELEVNERPIHCSDGKRETLYIKDGNTWEKDDTNKTRLTNAIRKVAHKNMRMIPEWKKKYPDCHEYDSTKNDLYLKIVSNSMCGGSEEETENNYNKIKKNIIKEVIIDK